MKSEFCNKWCVLLRNDNRKDKGLGERKRERESKEDKKGLWRSIKWTQIRCFANELNAGWILVRRFNWTNPPILIKSRNSCSAFLCMRTMPYHLSSSCYSYLSGIGNPASFFLFLAPPPHPTPIQHLFHNLLAGLKNKIHTKQ